MDPHISTNIKTEDWPWSDDFLVLQQVNPFLAEDPPTFISKLSVFADRFDQACILNNNWPTPHNHRGVLAGFGASEILSVETKGNSFAQLQEFLERHPADWKLGYLTYDLKNELEDLHSANEDSMQWPRLHFFIPKILIYIKDNQVFVHGVDDAKTLFDEIQSMEIDSGQDTPQESNIEWMSRPDKHGYLKNVEQLIEEINQGNVYEINFCRNLSAKMNLDPAKTNIALNQHSPAPFSAYYKLNHLHLMCASPERFLQKSGNRLRSQPIKGTRRRSEDVNEDAALKAELQRNRKERSENVMITDLVRNDLSHYAERGSVKVDELFGVYSFPHVHQLISTVSCELKSETRPLEALKKCFPMGSMTGAPKLRAMKLIENHESFKRGIFSGSVGYFAPNGNFDFNVVIRSIQYNADNQMVSLPTGSAITAMCNPTDEWEECELKAKALVQCLNTLRND